MKELLFYLEELIKKEIDIKVNNEDIAFTSKEIEPNNLIRLDILQSTQIGFLFFDTETTGLITQKTNNRVSSQKNNPEWGKIKKNILNNLLKGFPKEQIDDARREVLKYVASQERLNSPKPTIVHLKKLVPSLYGESLPEEEEIDQNAEAYEISDAKLLKIAQEYYKIFLENKFKGNVDLVEFYGTLYKAKLDLNETNELHSFTSPTEELTDEIINLISWNNVKNNKAKKGTFQEKAASIIELFETGLKSNTKFIIAGHNIKNFDIPLLLLSFARLDEVKGTTYKEQFAKILENKKTYIFDTIKLQDILKKLEIPEISLPINKKQVTLQKFSGAKNPSQHSADGDVKTLIQAFERIIVLQILKDNETDLGSMKIFIDFLKKMKSEGLTKDPIIGYLFKGKYSNLFKNLDNNKQQEIEVAISKIRSAVLNIINDIAIIKNKNKKAIDQILINIINNTMGTKKQKKMKQIKKDYVFEEVRNFVINEKLKKRDKLPGRVRKFAKRMEVKDVPGFLKYFIKTKNEFLDKDYPIGYAIAMAYKISKLKFKVGK